MDIDAYPRFKTLEIEDLDIFNRAFERDPPLISEFTFTNLYAWRDVYKLQVAALEGLLIVRSDSEKQARFFNPIGAGNMHGAILQILKDTGALFIRIPEATASLFRNNPSFMIEPDPANSDYLYRVDDLIRLAGKKYDGKRNLIRKFKSMHTYEYVTLGPSTIKECLSFEETWCSVKDCDGIEGLSNERRAIREMVDNFSVLSLRAGAIRIDGEINAVAIGQKLRADTVVMHVLKGNPSMPGLYQTMLQEFLSREAAGIDYVNLEQDLGVEGLRKAKLSYHPVGMVQKYTLKINHG